MENTITLTTKHLKLVADDSGILLHQQQDAALAYKGALYYDNQSCSAEFLLQQYLQSPCDADFYQHLSGRFWLAILGGRHHAFIVNDIMGIEPCYYTLQQGTLYISSHLKQLKRQPIALSLSKQAIYNYIYFHCIPAPTTIYQQVSKLEPAKAVYFDNPNKANSALLYSPDFVQQTGDQRLHSQCIEHIEQAVKQHTGDKVAAFLSGGLDSSTVAGMLAKQQTPAATFSVGFEAKGYDETPYAMITAKHFNTKHKVLYLKPEQAAEAFVKVAQYFDEPFGNSSAMAAYFCAQDAKAHGFETLLAGDGGDELFAGNSRYARQKVFEPYLKLPSPIQKLLKTIFHDSFLANIPGTQKAASYISQARTGLPLRLQTHNFINQLGAEAIFTSEFLTDIDLKQPEQQLVQRYTECKSQHPTDAMLFLDWKFTLADNDLVKVRKMCELANINVEFPLLEKHLVDFSCLVPADIKLPGNKLRDFYKQSCKGFLADETLAKEKQGFGLPFGVWLHENEQLKTLALTTLQAFKQRNIVNHSLIEQVIAAHQQQHTNYYGELIWLLVVLELWLQQDEVTTHA
ncbi:asparagine synthetase B family protein [Rheinheimera sp. WS51]|uniref:asparagine synthetase B family protein n=1 Tax=Rheinheimera sp. WS51 TaxID=3425886 RepID=UPI003D932167